MTHKKITLIVQILAKPEHRALVKSELLKLVAPTKAEKGCLNYDLHQDNENKNLFWFYENWETRALWEMHNISTHVTQFKKATDGAVADFTLHEITHIT